MKQKICKLLGHKAEPENSCEWVVFSTAVNIAALMVECRNCQSLGLVYESTEAEWRRAFYAPSNPYRWFENDRVTLMEGDGCG